MNITKLSIDRPILLAVIFSIIVFFGIASYFQLNYELVPQFNPPVLTVATVYPGASPQEVEDEVSIVIEDALSAIAGIDVITTTSKENFSLVRLEMVAGTDVDLTLQDASRKLAGIASRLPSAARSPVLSRFDFNDLPVIRMGVFADLENAALTNLVDREIRPALTQIEGVADIRILGATEKEVMVSLDPLRLDIHRVSILQVLQVLGSSNVNIPAGFLEDGQTRLSLTQKGRFSDLNQVRNLELVNNPRTGGAIRLSDVADVYLHDRDPVVLSRINGKNALGIDIKKQSDANTVELSRAVRSRIDQLEAQYQDEGLSFEIAQDTSEFTLSAANAVITDLGLAIILVSIVMILFLHSLRNSLIVFVSIPTSIITTFVAMFLLGYSLNLLTLLGLSLAIGILVDDSIVVIENIYRHLEMGKDKRNASLIGRREIGFTAVSITLIDVVVFVPIILASGMVADLLRQFAVVIVVSTLMSLFVSFTLVPFLTSRFGKANLAGEGSFGGIALFVEKVVSGAVNELLIILRWAFRHPLLIFVGAFLLLLASAALIPLGLIGVEFTKAGDRSEFILELSVRSDATLSETNRTMNQAEQILMSYQEVETIFTNVGITSSGRIETNTANLGEIYVKLVNKQDRNMNTAEFARHIKYALMEAVPGLLVRPIDINLIGLRNDDAVQVTIMGVERDEIAQQAGRIASILDNIPGTIEVTQSIDEPRKEVIVVPDREKQAMLGVDLVQAGATLRTAFNGNEDNAYVSDGESMPIRVILDERSRISSADIEHLTVLSRQGKQVPFMDFAVILDSLAPSGLERTNRTASVTVKSQVIGRPGGSVSNDLQNALNGDEQLDSAGLLWGGSTKRTQEGIRTMGIALAISIILVYLILVALYDSFLYPFAVFFSIPMAVIGAFLALALSMQTLSIFSIMGMIMLIGLVGKNAILVVDFANKLRLEGQRSIEDALLEAVRLRFRPILMTNLTMIIGLLPIALAGGAGSEWKNGLAWVLIGGLSSSMLLTLVLVPLVYLQMDKWMNRAGLNYLDSTTGKTDHT